MMANTVETKISLSTPEGLRLKGYLLDRMIGKYSLGDLLYLLMTDQLPSGAEGKMVEAMLVSCIDHGINAPSVSATRTVASCGVPVSTAVAAGILAIGEYHGGAGEACGRMLETYLANSPEFSMFELAENIINDFLERGERIPGLGHRLYKDVDPRAEKLFELAEYWQLAGKGVGLMREIEKVWTRKTGKRLAVNIDGAQAAILLDLNIPWQFAKGIFLIGRAAGLTAHAVEQAEHGKPFGFSAPITEDYQGPTPRPLPDE